MSNDPLAEPELELLDERPAQFGLIHLMGLTGGVSLATALLVPGIRALPVDLVAIMLVVLLGGLLFVIGHWMNSAKQRNSVLAIAGRRFSDRNEDKRSPQTTRREILAVGVDVLLPQIGVGSLVYLLGRSDVWHNDIYWIIVFCEIQVVYFVAHRSVLRRWSLSDDHVEFFENGVVAQSFQFSPWERVVVRPSQLYNDRINLHIESATRYAGPTLKTVFVSPEMKQYLLKHHGEKERIPQATGDTV